jgi:hypothetical protein
MSNSSWFEKVGDEGSPAPAEAFSSVFWVAVLIVALAFLHLLTKGASILLKLIRHSSDTEEDLESSLEI